MYILAIDTATNSGGVALSRNREVVGLVLLKSPLRYSELLLPMIEFLLQQHQLTLNEIGCLSVAAGPGSFTGLRVGLAVVKALGQAASIPAIGVSTLEALATGCAQWGRPIAAMIDARRQQVYGAAYRPDGMRLERVVPEQVCRPEAFLENLPGEDFVFVGDGTRLYRGTVEAARPAALILPQDNRLLDALCTLGFQGYAEGRAQPVRMLQANYVRPSDAELNKKLG